VLFTDDGAAHSASVVALVFMRHNKYFLSASEDRAVRFWDMNGHCRGVLSFGTKLDKVIRPVWDSPIDVPARNLEKKELAHLLRDKLNLRIVRFSSLDKELSRRAAMEKAQKSNPLESTIGAESLTSLYSQSIVFLPDRQRVIGQLTGEVTYKQSIKDQHRGSVGSPLTHLRHSLSTIESTISPVILPRRRRKASAELDSDPLVRAKIAMEEDADYMESILASTNIPKEQYALVSLKTRFDAEIQRFDNTDPLNWEISSNNKQRHIYANLYRELTTKGMTRDQIRSLTQKLNLISPGGDFAAYLIRAWAEVTASKPAKITGVMPAVRSSILTQSKLDVPQLDLRVNKSCLQQKPHLGDLKTAVLPAGLLAASSSSHIAASRSQPGFLPKKVDAFAKDLPVQMKAGLNVDLQNVYLENHGKVERAYEKFAVSLKEANKCYRKAGRLRRKLKRGRRFQLEPLHTLPRDFAIGESATK
jgi:hypothetical protein